MLMMISMMLEIWTRDLFMTRLGFIFWRGGGGRGSTGIGSLVPEMFGGFVRRDYRAGGTMRIVDGVECTT